MRSLNRVLTAAMIVLGAWAAPLPARAAPAVGHIYTVNSTLDEPDADPSNGVCSSTPSGQCTLRAAIMEANVVTGPITITLPAGTYLLTRWGYDDTALVGDLDIGHDLTLQGAGSAVTIVDGNGGVTGDRVFQVLDTVQNVTLRGLTIRHGHAADAASLFGQHGGGIALEGTRQQILDDVILEANTAEYGGGLATIQRTVQHEYVTIVHSQVISNSATFDGGGLYVPDFGLDVFESLVRDNTAGRDGAGLEATYNSPVAQVVDSTFSHNIAGQDGGGLAAIATVEVEYTTFRDNVAGRDGGGLNSYGGQAMVVNSTLSGNASGEAGGGFFAEDSTTILLNATIAGNWVRYTTPVQPILGGGLYLTHTAIHAVPVITASNSILANNLRISSKGPRFLDDCYSANSHGIMHYNLFTTMAACTTVLGGEYGNLVVADPLLGPLQDNGGPTFTQALLPGSQAIDAGDPAGCTGFGGFPLSLDQRIAPRPVSGCDIGAYEVVPEADLAVGQRDSPDPARVGVPLTYTVAVTNTGPVNATVVVLTDTPPLGATTGAATPSQGTCTGGLSFTCVLGNLASGATVTMTLVVTPTAAGMLTNAVKAAGHEFDPALANNGGSETTTVVIIRRAFLPLVQR